MIDLVAERTGLAGLQRFLDDPSVTEVMVNGGGQVWVERNGTMHHVGSVTETALMATVERILGPLGRRLDRLSPVVDARLPDGSRLCAVIPPVAVDGPCIAIRRFATAALGLSAFAGADVHDLLRGLTVHRANVLISGATSTGKTTLLNALCALVPAGQRIVTIEDVAELQLHHPHVVRLEARPPTAEGLGEVDIAALVRLALRLRPDRLVLGEVRSAEALPLLQAMNTGHDGSLATIHANSAADAIRRLCSLVLTAAPGWPVEVVSDLARSAIDAVVHIGRDAEGRRTVREVIEPGMAVHRVLVDDGVVVAAPSRRR